MAGPFRGGRLDGGCQTPDHAGDTDVQTNETRSGTPFGAIEHAAAGDGPLRDSVHGPSHGPDRLAESRSYPRVFDGCRRTVAVRDRLSRRCTAGLRVIGRQFEIGPWCGWPNWTPSGTCNWWWGTGSRVPRTSSPRSSAPTCGRSRRMTQPHVAGISRSSTCWVSFPGCGGTC